ncbi:phosphatidate cytidylyltransferase [Ruminococcaceae bacterium OttesenSCG-928-L11]|nr:phosphatidate cytidylyltransferase [Ruminococcaceae bacterium OttesenSCG-928-L11]
MRQRVISSLVGLLLLAVVYLFLDTLVLNIVIGAIGVIAVLELLSAVKCSKYRGLSVLCVAISVTIPFAQETAVRRIMPQLMFFYIGVFFLILLKDHQKLRVEQASMMFFFSLFVPIFFACAVFIRNRFGPVIGGFYLLWALGSAWLSDTGAYFAGRAFGKHKLAPLISPKKTVEGAVGGVITSTVFMLLFALLFDLGMNAVGTPVRMNYLWIALFTPFFSIGGMLGDLSASVIKRQYGVKDFGNIMPGHGGVLDRFDSVLFTLPSVFIIVEYVSVTAFL